MRNRLISTGRASAESPVAGSRAPWLPRSHVASAALVVQDAAAAPPTPSCNAGESDAVQQDAVNKLRRKHQSMSFKADFPFSRVALVTTYQRPLRRQRQPGAYFQQAPPTGLSATAWWPLTQARAGATLWLVDPAVLHPNTVVCLQSQHQQRWPARTKRVIPQNLSYFVVEHRSCRGLLDFHTFSWAFPRPSLRLSSSA